MKIFESFIEKINEEFLGIVTYYSKLYDQTTQYEVYKNPKSIKKFEEFLRLVISPDGDLYCLGGPRGTLIHEDILKIISRNYGVKIFTPVYGNLKKQILLSRYEKTNYLCLSESYREDDYEKKGDKDKIITLFKKCKNKNPHYTFVLSNVYEFDELEDIINDPSIKKI